MWSSPLELALSIKNGFRANTDVISSIGAIPAKNGGSNIRENTEYQNNGKMANTGIGLGSFLELEIFTKKSIFFLFLGLILLYLFFLHYYIYNVREFV